jgi:hypothetical protein
MAVEILKCVQSTKRGCEFATEAPSIRDKFAADVTVHKQSFGRPYTATSPASSAMYGAGTVHMPTTEVRKTLCTWDRSTAQRILTRAKWKIYISRLLHHTVVTSHGCYILRLQVHEHEGRSGLRCRCRDRLCRLTITWFSSASQREWCYYHTVR